MTHEIIVMPAVIGQSFYDALAAALRSGADAFHDPETGALIAIDPSTRLPGPNGLMVRHLRLTDQREARKWHRRLWRWVTGS